MKAIAVVCGYFTIVFIFNSTLFFDSKVLNPTKDRDHRMWN